MKKKKSDPVNEVIKFGLQAHEYLKDANWKPLDIGIAFLTFRETHGEAKTRALADFIREAKKRGEKREMIAVTLGHDLNHAKDAFCFPRSASYMERITKKKQGPMKGNVA